MNGLFKKANLNTAFSVASEIISIISSEYRYDELDAFLYPDAISHDEFFIKLLNENINMIMKPSKRTLLHVFIDEFYDKYIFSKFFYFEEIFFDYGDYEELLLMLEQVRMIFEDYGLNVDEWKERIEQLITKFDLEYEKDEPIIKPLEKEVVKLTNDMRSTTLALKNDVVENVFFLLFSNKKFLFDFNLMISEYITPQNLSQNAFNQSNHIIRCTSIPKWLENGILYRDRATCQQCGADLSNSFFIQESGRLHFDHIIPLEKGGTNDSTNFQLLCSTCNLTKNDNLRLPNYHYQMFW